MSGVESTADKKAVPFNLRLPIELHRALAERAKLEDRSIHNLILRLLREGLALHV